jgi:molecular chaperone DnaK
MSRSTIDFGIDLGTTNSAISVLDGIEPQVIKNTEDQDVTASAIWINKKEVIRVGHKAKNATILQGCEGDVYTEFKRMMGTPHQYEFESSGLRKKPEELSAELLKELRTSVQAKTGEIVESAVITVPAAFELHQCDATRRAATLAGFKASPLLQEPVAAALAYGFQIDSEKAYWLVYDFGGGTFDAALIKAEEGMINVVHHGGDNFLGGSDIDWAVIEKILIPRLTKDYDLSGFTRGAGKWKRAFQLLKHGVEAAKLELSTKEVTTLGAMPLFNDSSGETIEGEDIVLTRNDLIRVAEPLVKKSIEISQRVLKDKNLGLQAIQRVIVVGGPTKAPYFREMLSDGLDIPIDFSRDPLTVVSSGAAVFASTQKIDAALRKKAVVGEFQVQISEKYKPVGHECDPLIAGKITSPNDLDTNGFTIEFTNRDTKWSSGQIPLNADGAFIANLLAEKGSRNTFHIALSNSQGNLQKTVPDHVNYTIGAVIEEQPLLKSIGLAKADNTVDWLFMEGSGLPQRKRAPKSYETTIPLIAGKKDGALKIPVVEGEMLAADRNRIIGELVIDGTMVKRNLPVGSEVEITLRIDQSRTIKLEAYFPTLDEPFEDDLTLEMSKTETDDLIDKFEEEKSRLKSLQKKAEDGDIDELVDELEKIESDDDRDAAVKAARGDIHAAEKARAELVKLQNQLDAAEEKLKWPASVEEARDLQERLANIAEISESESLKEKASDWSEVVEVIIDKKQQDRMSRKLVEGHQLHFQLLASIPAFWVGRFQAMEKNRGVFTDEAAAERLFERGRMYLQENNVDGLTDVVRKLWSLMPEEEAERQQRGVGSTII